MFLTVILTECCCCLTRTVNGRVSKFYGGNISIFMNRWYFVWNKEIVVHFIIAVSTWRSTYCVVRESRGRHSLRSVRCQSYKECQIIEWGRHSIRSGCRLWIMRRHSIRSVIPGCRLSVKVPTLRESATSMDLTN